MISNKRFMEIEDIHRARATCGMGCRGCVCEETCYKLYNSKEQYEQRFYSNMQRRNNTHTIPERRNK